MLFQRLQGCCRLLNSTMMSQRLASLWTVNHNLCSMLSSPLRASLVVEGHPHLPVPDQVRFILTVGVRPGPWKSRDAQHKDLGRVFGADYAAAKILNCEISWEADRVMLQLSSSRSIVDSRNLAMQYLDYIGSLVEERGEMMTFVNVSTAVHRVGRVVGMSGASDYLIPRQERLIQRLAALTYEHLDEFGPRQLSNLFWGLGKLGRGVRLISLNLPVPTHHSPTMNDIVRMLLKKVKIYRTKLLPVHFSNVFLGLAYLDYKRCLKFKAKVAEEIKPKLKDFTAQHLANFSWALSKLRFDDEIGLLPSMDQAARKKIREFSVRELCGFLQGMTMLGHHDCHGLFDESMPSVRANLSRMSLREMCTLIWVWSKAMYHPGVPILNAMIRLHAGSICGQHRVLAVTLLSMAHLNHQDASIFAMADQFLTSNIPMLDYTVRDICNILWGLSILDSVRKEHLICAGHKLKRVSPKVLSPPELNQLYQCYVNVQIRRKEWSSCLKEFLSPEMYEGCRQAWVDLQDELPYPHIVGEVGYAIKSLGLDFETRLAPEIPTKINVVSDKRGRKVVVEIITASRGFVNDRSLVSGTYLWRERILKALGWMVVRVNQKIFEEQHLLVEKKKYLESILPGGCG